MRTPPMPKRTEILHASVERLHDGGLLLSGERVHGHRSLRVVVFQVGDSPVATVFFLKNGPFPASFSLFSFFQYTVDS